METGLVAAIIAAAATITAAIITGVIAIIKENSKLNKIIRHLGFGEGEASMKMQLDERFGKVDERFGKNNSMTPKSVCEQTGVGTDDKSLTKQHDDLREVIIARTESITAISQIIHDEEVRRSSLASEQQSLLHTVNALVYDWELTHQKLSELEHQLSELEAENEQLKHELSELREETQDSESDSECEQ